jgi:hypothetical protein
MGIGYTGFLFCLPKDLPVEDCCEPQHSPSSAPAMSGRSTVAFQTLEPPDALAHTSCGNEVESILKEDVLEQLVDDYLMHKGYFTLHNLRFKPSAYHTDFSQNADCVHSNIDVIAVDPRRNDTDRVLVLSCKAWQEGFDPAAKVAEIEGNKIISGRAAWKGFRELCVPKWSEAFLRAVGGRHGHARVVYCAVVTALRNSAARSVWEGNPNFRAAMEGNPIRILTLAEILDYLWPALTKTPAASEIGRALQLMKAAPVQNGISNDTS